MTIIEETFRALRERKEAALIAYVTAGDPSLEYTPRIADALIEGGADIVELGIPFSDPIADGKTIQAAAVRALNAGTTPPLVLKIAERIKNKHGVPIIVLTYYNILYNCGLEGFLGLAKKSGVDGVVVPDLPFEEAEDYRKVAGEVGIETVFLAAPSTTKERLLEIMRYTSGFLYLVSLFGVTGERSSLPDSAIRLVREFSAYTKGVIPLAVGFGISRPEQIRELTAAGADGVIVGSAFVRVIEQNCASFAGATDKLTRMTRRFKMATCQGNKPD
ncbi:tryptophan synthase subunit alpha [Candidatus Bathyarchaeota archaeon]|nr:tryptophan synthase subunit alpha [Candidatus Bathyarchaeota archaeon]